MGPFFVALRLVMASLSLGAAPRIVATSPQVAQILSEIGCEERLVAVSDFTALTLSLPQIGSPFRPSLERIFSIQSDLVVLDKYANQDLLGEALNQLKIPWLAYSPDSLESLARFVVEIMPYCYQPSERQRLLELHLKCLGQFLTYQPKTDFKFLVFAWTSPPILFGRNTLLSRLITQVGGRNLLAPELLRPFPQVSMEWLITQEVDISFVMLNQKDDLSGFTEMASHWWPKRRVRLLPLNSPTFSQPSFRTLQELMRLMQLPLPPACGDSSR